MVVLLSRTMGCYINPALSRRLRAGHTGCLSLLPSHSDGMKMIFAPTVQTWVEGLFHSQKKSQKVPSLLENWISVESEVGPRTDQDFTSKNKKHLQKTTGGFLPSQQRAANVYPCFLLLSSSLEFRTSPHWELDFLMKLTFFFPRSSFFSRESFVLIFITSFDLANSTRVCTIEHLLAPSAGF